MFCIVSTEGSMGKLGANTLNILGGIAALLVLLLYLGVKTVYSIFGYKLEMESGY
ncbi:MAG: hypothetical protein KW788_03725 [Candidatus Doudnabacteria bacterium]|nr:hypothetical protein [Candidatus Doudnabacteria bacterium]